MADYIILKDINGHFYIFNPLTITNQLVEQKSALFGVPIKLIPELLAQYERRGGGMPMTRESIEEAFDD